MRVIFKLALGVVLAAGSISAVQAQDLAPRAYVITPVHSNAITITWSFFDGGVNFNGTIPVTNATGTYYISVINYYHSMSFLAARQILRFCCPMQWEISRATSRDNIDRYTVRASPIPAFGFP